MAEIKPLRDIITRYAAAVIGYSDIVDSAVAYLHGYGAAACIESVSTSSLTMLAGRSTTSPQQFLLAVFGSSIIIRLFMLHNTENQMNLVLKKGVPFSAFLQFLTRELSS